MSIIRHSRGELVNGRDVLAIAIACFLAAALLVLSGCATMTTGEKVFLVGSAVDVASTYYSVSRGCIEANPLWGARSMTALEAAGTATLVSVAGYFALKWYSKKVIRNRYEESVLFGGIGGVRLVAGGLNATGTCK